MTDARKLMGAHLKRVRESAGVSRVSLAATIGVSQSAVTQWENGETAPRLQHQIALRAALREPTLYTGEVAA